MIRFLFNRLLQSLLVLFVVVSATFLLMRIAPGSPFSAERRLSPEVEQRLMEKYGLDGSLPSQFVRYWWHLLHGDLGDSTMNLHWSVSELIAQALPHSLLLGLISFFLALGVGIVAGSYAAVHHNTWRDRGAMLLALLGICLPSFLLAPLAILFFSIYIPIFPPAGWSTWSHIVLPAICLAAPYAAYCARLMRGSMLETLNQDFIRTARAKGVNEQVVIYLHALKVALLPILSFSGPLAANLLTGSLVIEKIFQIPGIGQYFVNSVLNLDCFMTGGVVAVYCALLVTLNFIVDVLYRILDQRIRTS